MNEIMKRFKSETPVFFKNIRSFGIYLMGVSATLLATPKGIHIPDFVIQLAGYAATAGFIMSTVATLAKVDKGDEHLGI